MSGIRITSLPLIGFWLFCACGSPFIKGAEVEKINEDWSEREFVARQDIPSPFINALEQNEEVVFKKGTRLKVWLEGAEDWVRVKAYPASERREQTRGRTIIYIFEDDLKKEDRKTKKVKALLQNKFNQFLLEG